MTLYELINCQNINLDEIRKFLKTNKFKENETTQTQTRWEYKFNDKDENFIRIAYIHNNKQNKHTILIESSPKIEKNNSVLFSDILLHLYKTTKPTDLKDVINSTISEYYYKYS